MNKNFVNYNQTMQQAMVNVTVPDIKI